MRVLLVTPVSRRVNERWMPLGVCSLAAALIADGHDVKLFDRYRIAFNHDRDETDRQMEASILNFKPDIVGFSTYSQVIIETMHDIRLARSLTDALIVLGGHHASALPELTLQRIPEADAVIAGEGEVSLCLLANKHIKDEIPGLYWRDNCLLYQKESGAGYYRSDLPAGILSIHKSTASRNPIDLTRLPLPAYHLLDMEFYTKRNVGTIRPFFLRVGSIMATRGCTNRCSFCTESLTFSGGIRHHNHNHVIEMIQHLVETYHCDGITFLDNSFLADPDFAQEILKSVIASGLHRKALFCIQSRVDQITDEIALLMQKANFLKIEFGLESADPIVLLETRKNATVQEAENALQICKKYDLSIQANLIMGLENDSIDRLNATLNWVKKLPVDNVKWGSLFLSPGSLLYRQKADMYLEEHDWTKANIDFFFTKDHLSGLLPGELESWRDMILNPSLKHLHRISILHRNPINRLVQYYWTRLLMKGKSKWQKRQSKKRLKKF